MYERVTIIDGVADRVRRNSRALGDCIVTTLKKLLAALKRRYGTPALPPARGPFELVLWENACYLMPDDRRREVFEGLRRDVGLTPAAILAADRGVLLSWAKRGGMRPEVRVLRWLEIARICRDQFGGDLDSILSQTYAQAKKALKQFPTIGDPGAEKILLFCGLAPGLPLESNGLRVLTRVGYGREHLKNYGQTYKSVQEAIAAEIPQDPERMTAAHLLLRQHGKEVCHTNEPACYDCPIAAECAYPAKRMQSFLRTDAAR
jgi:endonuclease III